MYKLAWVIVHRDFMNLDYPAYYNRETAKLDSLATPSQREFADRVEAEKIRNALSGQLHSGTLSIEVAV